MDSPGRIGRPKRLEPYAKLTINIAIKSKRNAFALATKRDTSIGRLFESLVDREIAEERNGSTERRRRR